MSTALLVIGGLVLLGFGGEWLVRGSVGLARRFDVSPLLAGLVIVGFGTSAPELVTSIDAALLGAPDIALGNIIGSNIANILLILGASALFINLPIKPAHFYRDGFFMMVATLSVVAGVVIGGFDRFGGFLLFMLLLVYLIGAYMMERHDGSEEVERQTEIEKQKPDKRRSTPFLVGETLAGLAAIIIGADWLVNGSIDVARAWGISEAVIGLTIVAVGTSLPELVACIAAALNRQPSIVLGNVIGSCIYNALGILGLTALVHPLGIPPEIARFDIWILAAATGFIILFLRSGWTIHRHEGIALLLGYAAYISWLVFGN